ncbi:MAG: hypothetical protein ACLSAF_08605 [Intestinimonas sp.]
MQVKTLSASLSGRVSADGSKPGKYAFASDVEILDTYGESGALRVYPRPAGRRGAHRRYGALLPAQQQRRDQPPHPQGCHR